MFTYWGLGIIVEGVFIGQVTLSFDYLWLFHKL